MPPGIYVRTPEHRKSQSERAKGKTRQPWNAEMKARISASNKGKHYWTSEQKAERVGVLSTNFRHGMYGSSTYGSWKAMLQRCRDPNYSGYLYYGGRGIRICERWLSSFNNFHADMGDRPTARHPRGRLIYSLDRIDNDGNYEPDNCRWATGSQQQSNRRKRQKK